MQMLRSYLPINIYGYISSETEIMGNQKQDGNPSRLSIHNLPLSFLRDRNHRQSEERLQMSIESLKKDDSKLMMCACV